MIYESASPLGPALPLQFSSWVYACYIDTFRICIYPELQFHLTAELFSYLVSPGVTNMLSESDCSLLSSTSKKRCFLCHQPSLNPALPTTNHSPHHTEPGSLYSTVFFEQNGCLGETEAIFMCKCQSVRSQQSQAHLLQRSGLETQPE